MRTSKKENNLASYLYCSSEDVKEWSAEVEYNYTVVGTERNLSHRVCVLCSVPLFFIYSLHIITSLHVVV